MCSLCLAGYSTDRACEAKQQQNYPPRIITLHCMQLQSIHYHLTLSLSQNSDEMHTPHLSSGGYTFNSAVTCDQMLIVCNYYHLIITLQCTIHNQFITNLQLCYYNYFIMKLYINATIWSS
jgi:hypothetical protein